MAMYEGPQTVVWHEPKAATGSQLSKLQESTNLLANCLDVLEKSISNLENKIAPICVNLPKVPPPQAAPSNVPVELRCEVLNMLEGFSNRVRGLTGYVQGIQENVNI